MTITGDELEVIKRQLVSGNIPSGSLLAEMLNELSSQELEQVKKKAAEGSLGLEFEKIARSHKSQSSSVFQSKSVAIRLFIKNMILPAFPCDFSLSLVDSEHERHQTL